MIFNKIVCVHSILLRIFQQKRKARKISPMYNLSKKTILLSLILLNFWVDLHYNHVKQQYDTIIIAEEL